MNKITLGSLFDGSGGFPLAARNLGMEPIWASEIEPFPVLVTRKNFPDMKHLGSITQLKGNLIEPVDVITLPRFIYCGETRGAKRKSFKFIL